MAVCCFLNPLKGRDRGSYSLAVFQTKNSPPGLPAQKDLPFLSFTVETGTPTYLILCGWQWRMTVCKMSRPSMTWPQSISHLFLLHFPLAFSHNLLLFLLQLSGLNISHLSLLPTFLDSIYSWYSLAMGFTIWWCHFCAFCLCDIICQ